MARIFIGSDHAGFELKEKLITLLRDLNWQPEDCGACSTESCDYPLIAHDLCQKVSENNACGILVCGTGVGMSIAANRHRDIRAALCATELQARLSRKHNNANVLCLGARMIGVELAIAIVVAFLESEFEGGRHLRRINQLNPNA